MSEIYMMVTICNRKQMQKFVKFYKQNHVDTGNISLANSLFLLPMPE